MRPSPRPRAASAGNASVSLVRPLAADPRLADPDGARRARADDRARGRGRGARPRRRVRARAPLRAAAGLAVPAAGRDRRRARAGSRSAPPSSTCATRTRSTWPRRPRPPTCISDGRLQLGISRGSPEPALRGSEAFGYVPGEDETDADMARAHTTLFRHAIAGAGVVAADPRMTGSTGRAGDPAAVARAWPTGSGGEPAPARPPSGPRSRA